MKQRSIASLTLMTLTLSVGAFAADAPKPGEVPAVPKGCVKLEDEIKISGNNVYFDSDLGHFTAGKLEISLLNAADSTAVGTIRGDGIKDLKDDDTFLTKGDVTIEAKPLSGDPAPATYANAPFSPKASISLQIQKIDDENANISGSIKLKDEFVRLVKLNLINPRNPNTPISVCGVGMNLSISHDRKMINGGSLIFYINNGSDTSIIIQAQNNRDGKAISNPINSETATVEDGVGVGSAM